MPTIKGPLKINSENAKNFQKNISEKLNKPLFPLKSKDFDVDIDNEIIIKKKTIKKKTRKVKK